MHLKTDQHDLHLRYFKERSKSRNNLIEQKFGQPVVEYIAGFLDMANPGVEVYSTKEWFNIEMISSDTVEGLVNLKRVNDIAEPNEFFKLVNCKLPRGKYFIGCFESQKSRHSRLVNKYRQPFTYPALLFDFTLKRIFPKTRLTRRIYSLLTRGENRVMSMTETLGRLVSCGFEVVDCRDIGYLTYFVCKKVGMPSYNGTENHGLIIKLKRVGQGGRYFDVLKFRTMHPFAEYLQDYVHQKNNICTGGKFNDDFRITSWGRVLRKLWLDEQPMWLNLFKGEMKLVGVRPLSEHYFSLYPGEMQELRVKYKPGLIPPFYVDLPESFEEIVESERKYLEAYARSPLLTDFVYFWKAFYNIFLKKARSA